METGFGKVTAMQRKRMVVGRGKKALRIVAESEVLSWKSSTGEREGCKW